MTIFFYSVPQRLDDAGKKIYQPNQQTKESRRKTQREKKNLIGLSLSLNHHLKREKKRRKKYISRTAKKSKQGNGEM